MSDEIWTAIIQSSPALLTLAVALVLLIRFHEPLVEKLKTASRVSIAGFELESAGAALSHARERSIPSLVARSLVRRTKEMADELGGLRVLWVDDHPARNRFERRYFRAAGITVVNALSTSAGLAELRTDDYDIVITNFRRGESPTAGLELREQAQRDGYDVPFVGYIGAVDPSLSVPSGFAAVTDQPDTLVTAVLDLADARL